MSEQDLLTLLKDLLAIPEGRVVEPDLPVNSFCEQSEQLAQAAERDRVALLSVGVRPEHLDRLGSSLEALRAAEARHEEHRRSKCSSADDLLVHEGTFELRDEAYAAASWGLRDDPEAAARLEQLAGRATEQPCSVADDLEQQAALFREKAGSFRIPDFDATAYAQQLEQRAARLRASPPPDDREEELKELRDRSFTHALESVEEIKAAARFLFKHEPQRLADYGDPDADQMRQPRKQYRRRRTSGVPSSSDADPPSSQTD